LLHSKLSGIEPIPPVMKKTFSLLVLLTLQISTIADAQSKKKNKSATDSTIPPGANHIVLKSVGDAKQFFTYSPIIAIPEVPQPQDGLYRIEVNEKGNVAAVTILKGISPNADTWVMNELVGWYAKPGPLRVVDVPVPYARTPKLADPFTSRRTGLPPGHKMPPSP
jgi:hypothetical protein